MGPFWGANLNRITSILALFVIMVGFIVCPFTTHHTAELNPFHNYLFPIPGNEPHIHSFQVSHQHEGHAPLIKNRCDNPAAGGSADTASIHNYDSITMSGIVTVSGSATMGQSDIPFSHPGISLVSPEPRPLYPQEFVSLPDKPPPLQVI